MDRYSIKISQAGKGGYLLSYDEATADEIILSKDGRIGCRSIDGHGHSFEPGTWDAAEITLLRKDPSNHGGRSFKRKIEKMKEMLAALASRDKTLAK